MSNNVLINMRYGPSVGPNDRISAELSFCFFLWTSTSSRSMKTPKKKKKNLISSHFDRTSLVNKRCIFWNKNISLIMNQSFLFPEPVKPTSSVAP